MHCLIHIHENLNFESNFFGDILLLADVVAFMGAKECALSTHSLLVTHTNKL